MMARSPGLPRRYPFKLPSSSPYRQNTVKSKSTGLFRTQRLKKFFRLGSLREILAQCDCLLDAFAGEFFLTVLIVSKSKVIENRWILAFEFFIALLQKGNRGRIY